MTPRIAADQKEALAERRIEQILQAAMQLWASDGFDSTTVDAIAREAGLAKGTVYLYFKTKQDILDEAISRHSLLPDIREQLAALDRSSISPEHALPLVLKVLWVKAKERVGIFRIVLREVIVRPEHARRLIETVILPANRHMAEFLQPLVDAGRLREVDLFIASRALAGMLMVFLLSQEILGGKDIHPLSDDEITDTIADLFLRGVLPRPEGDEAS